MRERAAELFSWAVAPLVRDPHRAPDLRPLFNIVLKDGRDTGMEWLRRLLVAPPGGRAPDLPPQLWQQVVTDLLAHAVSVPVTAPARAPAPAPPAAVPAPAPAPATPPMPLPASYAAASAIAPPPPKTAPTRPAHPAPQASARPAPTGGDSRPHGLLYEGWFVPTFAGVVGAAVIGVLLMILLN